MFSSCSVNRLLVDFVVFCSSREELSTERQGIVLAVWNNYFLLGQSPGETFCEKCRSRGFPLLLSKLSV